MIYGAYRPTPPTPRPPRNGVWRWQLRALGGRDGWFWNHYVNEQADNRNPLAVPLLADLEGLPPLLVTAAELDPLFEDSDAAGGQAQAAGVPHNYVLWPGVTHACIHMTRMLDVAKRHIEDMAGWVRAQLQT